MTCRRLAIVGCAAVLMWLAGCARPIKDVQESHAGSSPVTLAQAYADLLDAPKWELVKQRESDPNTGKVVRVQYVKVSGNLAGTTAPFEAWYQVHPNSSEFVWFVLKGQKKNVDEFDRLLSSYYLTRELSGN